jgi:hypothetical protein
VGLIPCGVPLTARSAVLLSLGALCLVWPTVCAAQTGPGLQAGVGHRPGVLWFGGHIQVGSALRARIEGLAGLGGELMLSEAVSGLIGLPSWKPDWRVAVGVRSAGVLIFNSTGEGGIDGGPGLVFILEHKGGKFLQFYVPLQQRRPGAAVMFGKAYPAK